MDNKLYHHYQDICRPLLQGRVIPFLGAGVNLYGREGNPFVLFRDLPSGQELTQHLATECRYPAEEPLDLMRVSQYARVMMSTRFLNDKLHEVFDQKYPITPLHQFLAGLPALQSRMNPQRMRPLLIITTNYDDVLERAFDGTREPYDLVYYEAQEDGGGGFRYRAPDGQARPISKSKPPALLQERPVVLKIHGTVITGKGSGREDSYVITEDHYIDFMAGRDILSLLPASLREHLMDRDTSFLFLGYGLRDWNMRVVLRRIARDKDMTGKSYAIERQKREVDEKFWGDEVKLVCADLKEYIEGLQEHIQTLTPVGGGA
jgi:hypothetical protein